MLDSIKEVLITEEALRERVAELGKQISADYKGEDVVLVCVLKGAVVFFADLARVSHEQCSIRFYLLLQLWQQHRKQRCSAHYERLGQTGRRQACHCC